MLLRKRTAKQIAKRIDLQYFARPHPFRRWRLMLSIIVPVVAAIWLLSSKATGNQKVYSSGPMSPAHAVFGKNCATCHLTQAGVFREHVQDKACLGCHDAPEHNVRQVAAPTCGSCHVEHEGKLTLARTSDQTCTQCHSNLQKHIGGGAPKVEKAIYRFSGGHPEFAALRKPHSDPGAIKLNHYVHLQPTLRGPDNQQVQIDCAACHRTPAAKEPWPFGTAEFRTVAAKLVASNDLHRNYEDPFPVQANKAYMAPIKFDKQCAACHSLQFDIRFSEGVPHEKPEVVHAFLVKKFSDYIAAHPAEVHQVEGPNRLLPGRERPLPIVAKNAAEWVQLRVADSEKLLWNKTCKQCHTLTSGESNLPGIAKANVAGADWMVPVKWMPHAQFDHNAHRMVKCDSCHSSIRNSRDTADVNLPGIKTCQECHVSQAAASNDFAEGRCFECHQYHDWSKQKQTTPKFSIPELLGKRAAAEARPTRSRRALAAAMSGAGER